MEYRLGELFCGPGGLSLGAVSSYIKIAGKKISIKHVWASDYHKDSCDTYIHNICKGKPGSVICTDVKDLDIGSLPPIDAFAYGFPCNDFSNVGEKKGFDGTYGALYSYGVKILNIHHPKFFVAENVSGLTSKRQEKAFTRILNELSSAGPGYEITAHLYKAEEYGIPQLRHRVIIVGIQKPLEKKFQVPAPTHHPDTYKTCQEAIEVPPIEEGVPNNEYTKQSSTVIERLRYIGPGENAWSPNVPDHLKLNVPGARLSQIYRRMDPSRPAFTITGSGGGGTHGYHWKEDRALTNRERARIQTFPDDFEFIGSKESVRRQIGMAVPPQLSRIIFESILKTLAGISYDSVVANIERDFL